MQYSTGSSPNELWMVCTAVHVTPSHRTLCTVDFNTRLHCQKSVQRFHTVRSELSDTVLFCQGVTSCCFARIIIFWYSQQFSDPPNDVHMLFYRLFLILLYAIFFVSKQTQYVSWVCLPHVRLIESCVDRSFTVESHKPSSGETQIPLVSASFEQPMNSFYRTQNTKICFSGQNHTVRLTGIVDL